MLLAYHYADFPLLLRPKSRYPLHKFSLLRDQVIATGVLPDSQVKTAPDVEEALLCLAHAPEYVSAVRDGTLSLSAQREMGFTWSEAMWIRGKRIVGAQLANIQAATEYGCAFSLGGGAHHSYRTHGKGFCIFNDLAIGALDFLKRRPKTRLAILDCDVHQGDGTASILASHPAVTTVSLHGEKNFPFRKEISSLDIPLADGIEDLEYLEALDQALAFIDRVARPDLLLYVAGADPFVEDELGRLSLSAAGLAERDSRVFRFTKKHGIPVSICFGGGYCVPIEKTVGLNLQTIRVAKEELGVA